MSESPEVHQDRHHARFKTLLENHQRRIGWSKEQLDHERFKALRRLLHVATGGSPWHRQRLAALDLDHICDDELLERLPVMTKSDLMVNFDAIVTDARLSRQVCEEYLDGPTTGPYLLGDYNVVASSGSSGQRGVFVYGWDDWATCYASIVRFQQHDWQSDATLIGVPRVTAVVGAAKSSHISAALGRTFSTPDTPRHIFPVTQPLSAIVKGLNELQPSMLMGYSSFLPRLVVEARAGRLHIAPRRVVAISEPLQPEVRMAVEEAWGAPVASGYGMSEGVFTGACPHGLHLPDDLCFVEALDPDGQPVGPGQRSHHLLVTNLYNHTLPLIRYEVSDEVTLVRDLCPCGCAMRRIEDPQGRLDDVFEYTGGVVVHPHLFRSVLARHGGIIEYQVRQTVRGAHVDVVVDQRTDLVDLNGEIESALRAVGIDDPRVTSQAIAAVARQPSGKLKRFSPLVE
ncbi:MAG: phenylacetate--CoA ligase family protein [Acidimicrobiales bacterium]